MSTLFFAERNDDEDDAEEDEDENDIEDVSGALLFLLSVSCVLFNIFSYKLEYFS